MRKPRRPLSDGSGLGILSPFTGPAMGPSWVPAWRRRWIFGRTIPFPRSRIWILPFPWPPPCAAKCCGCPRADRPRWHPSAIACRWWADACGTVRPLRPFDCGWADPPPVPCDLQARFGRLFAALLSDDTAVRPYVFPFCGEKGNVRGKNRGYPKICDGFRRFP